MHLYTPVTQTGRIFCFDYQREQEELFWQNKFYCGKKKKRKENYLILKCFISNNKPCFFHFKAFAFLNFLTKHLFLHIPLK